MSGSHACLFFVAAALAACCASEPGMASATQGTILAKQWCAECHSVAAGQQSPNPKAPAFSAIANEPSATDYGLHVFLKSTHETMPNFRISPDAIDDLVDYIRSLKTQP